MAWAQLIFLDGDLIIITWHERYCPTTHSVSHLMPERPLEAGVDTAIPHRRTLIIAQNRCVDTIHYWMLLHNHSFVERKLFCFLGGGTGSFLNKYSNLFGEEQNKPRASLFHIAYKIHGHQKISPKVLDHLPSWNIYNLYSVYMYDGDLSV